jgi:hypothetical protein
MGNSGDGKSAFIEEIIDFYGIRDKSEESKTKLC